MGYRKGRAREHSVRYKLMKLGWKVKRSYRSAGGDPHAEIKPIDLTARRCKINAFIEGTRCKNWPIEIGEETYYLECEEINRKQHCKNLVLWYIQVSKERGWISKEEIVELKRLAKRDFALPVLCYVKDRRYHFENAFNGEEIEIS